MSAPLSYAANGFGLFAVGAVGLFTALAHSPSAPFFWHPISMMLAFALFMVQGVLSLIGKSSMLHVAYELAERKVKIDAHYWFQVRSLPSFHVPINPSHVFRTSNSGINIIKAQELTNT